MVSKNQIKLIQSLHQKKHRSTHRMFIAEGEKVIAELLDSKYKLFHLYVTANLFTEVVTSKRSLVTDAEIKKMSALTTSNNCLAVFEIPENEIAADKGLIVALDDVRDPGNLGTIIRLCDWFGVRQIICSTSSADMYNPKVVQATMGSLTRVNVRYTDLACYLSTTNLPVIGTFMDGDNIYNESLPAEAVIVMGNEANGISDGITPLIQKRLSIPRFGDLRQAESLNVANATAILLSEFCRR